MPLAPHNPSKLLGSHWSRVNPEDRGKHWEVVRFDRRTGDVVLRGVLTGEEVRMPWRDLRDRERWLPGWV